MGTSNDRRTFIVSNRLPVRVHHERGRVEVVRSSGGLASALRSATSIQEWIGWSGGPVPQAMRARVRELLTAQGLMPVFLTAEEERHYYVNMCNGTLWPLLHYFPGRVEFDDRSWPAYCEVNRRFADTVLERTVAGDRVWIHDFHLFLLPQWSPAVYAGKSDHHIPALVPHQGAAMEPGCLGREEDPLYALRVFLRGVPQWSPAV